MKHYKFTAAQAAANCGFTDLFVLTKADLTETADNTAQSITLDALAAGDIVFQDVVVEVKTAWGGHADLTATLSVGVTSATTALTPALTICTAGTGAAAGVADTSDCQTNAHYVAASAINMLATFTPDADSGLDEFTGGEARIWMRISRQSNRAALAV